MEEKEEEKIPIGHRPLRGCCPPLNLNLKLLQQGTGTADHLTLLFIFFGVFERFELTAPAQMPHSDFLLKCPCPHARDKGSRVSIELVLKFTIQIDDNRSFNILPNANAKDYSSVMAPT